MSSDGSPGRDGFERWVASMKREQQPLQAKPAASKPMDKLELELDENATHVHRIPKDLINRMREQRANEQREARERAAPEPPKSAPEPPKPAPAPEPARASIPHAELAQAFASDMDDDDGSSMHGVSDDRTAVFRPPPELLARAKRMKPPSKPTPTSDLPTKPPPASLSSDGMDAAHAVPAPSRLPVFESVPVKASFSSSVPAARSNYAAATALDEPFAPSASAPDLAVEMGRASLTADAQPISSPEIERSAVFAHAEATSGVLSLGLPEATPESPSVDESPLGEATESVLAPMTNEALLNALTASASGESADASDEEAPAPTTTSPLVRSERSLAPLEASRAAAPRLSLWLAVALATAAFVFWRLHHGL